MSTTPRRSASPSRSLLGLGLDGHGLGPNSADGQTRVTRGEDYTLVGGGESVHGAMQQLAEHIAESCRSEGTTLGQAPPELIQEILTDLSSQASDDGDQAS